MLGREFDFNSYEERGSTHSFGTGSAATSQPSRGVTDAGRAGDRDRDKGGGPSGGGSPSGTVQRTFLRKGSRKEPSALHRINSPNSSPTSESPDGNRTAFAATRNPYTNNDGPRQGNGSAWADITSNNSVGNSSGGHGGNKLLDYDASLTRAARDFLDESTAADVAVIQSRLRAAKQEVDEFELLERELLDNTTTASSSFPSATLGNTLNASLRSSLDAAFASNTGAPRSPPRGSSLRIVATKNDMEDAAAGDHPTSNSGDGGYPSRPMSAGRNPRELYASRTVLGGASKGVIPRQPPKESTDNSSNSMNNAGRQVQSDRTKQETSIGADESRLEDDLRELRKSWKRPTSAAEVSTTNSLLTSTISNDDVSSKPSAGRNDPLRSSFDSVGSSGSRQSFGEGRFRFEVEDSAAASVRVSGSGSNNKGPGNGTGTSTSSGGGILRTTSTTVPIDDMGEDGSIEGNYKSGSTQMRRSTGFGSETDVNGRRSVGAKQYYGNEAAEAEDEEGIGYEDDFEYADETVPSGRRYSTQHEQQHGQTGPVRAGQQRVDTASRYVSADEVDDSHIWEDGGHFDARSAPYGTARSGSNPLAASGPATASAGSSGAVRPKTPIRGYASNATSPNNFLNTGTAAAPGLRASSNGRPGRARAQSRERSARPSTAGPTTGGNSRSSTAPNAASVQGALGAMGAELAEEIAIYKRETAQLKALKKQHEAALADLAAQRSAVLTWSEAEKAKTTAWCEEQKALANKERRAAAKFARDAREGVVGEGGGAGGVGSGVAPMSRKERAEVAALQATVEKQKLDLEAARRKAKTNEQRLQQLLKDQNEVIAELDDKVAALEAGRARFERWLRDSGLEDLYHNSSSNQDGASANQNSKSSGSSKTSRGAVGASRSSGGVGAATWTAQSNAGAGAGAKAGAGAAENLSRTSITPASSSSSVVVPGAVSAVGNTTSSARGNGRVRPTQDLTSRAEEVILVDATSAGAARVLAPGSRSGHSDADVGGDDEDHDEDYYDDEYNRADRAAADWYGDEDDDDGVDIVDVVAVDDDDDDEQGGDEEEEAPMYESTATARGKADYDDYSYNAHKEQDSRTSKEYGTQPTYQDQDQQFSKIGATTATSNLSSTYTSTSHSVGAGSGGGGIHLKGRLDEDVVLIGTMTRTYGAADTSIGSSAGLRGTSNTSTAAIAAAVSTGKSAASATTTSQLSAGPVSSFSAPALAPTTNTNSNSNSSVSVSVSGGASVSTSANAGRSETVRADGTRVVSHRNGTTKEVYLDGEVRILFSNGDVKQQMPVHSCRAAQALVVAEAQQLHSNSTNKSAGGGSVVGGAGLSPLLTAAVPTSVLASLPLQDLMDSSSASGGRASSATISTVFGGVPPSEAVVVYFYGQARTRHSTFPSGIEVYDFPNGQVEHHYPNGEKLICFADGTTKAILASGIQESRFPDGVVVLEFPDGRREVMKQ